ncbi:acyltransferase domain-containing protein [Nocardia carnea]|uniref:acyltransferase domain-containing protein n=1 Tax=Nocardia carnea TaxID=37328 RepID=UPI003D7993A1
MTFERILAEISQYCPKLENFSFPIDTSDLETVQSVLFAVAVSWAELWCRWGISPAAVIGQSQGELAAAYFSRHIGLESAAQLIACRARLLSSLSSENTAVLAAGCGASDVLRFGGESGVVLNLVAVNSAYSTTVSGSRTDILKVMSLMENEGIVVDLIDSLRIAPHSPDISQLEAGFRAELPVSFPEPASPTTCPWFSSVTASRVEAGTGVRSSAYWYQNLRCTVRLGDALSACISEVSPDVLMESTPFPILGKPMSEVIRGCGRSSDIPIVSRRVPAGWSNFDSMLKQAARLYISGFDVMWNTVSKDLLPIRQ